MGEFCCMFHVLVDPISLLVSKKMWGQVVRNCTSIFSCVFSTCGPYFGGPYQFHISFPCNFLSWKRQKRVEDFFFFMRMWGAHVCFKELEDFMAVEFKIFNVMLIQNWHFKYQIFIQFSLKNSHFRRKKMQNLNLK